MEGEQSDDNVSELNNDIPEDDEGDEVSVSAAKTPRVAVGGTCLSHGRG